MSEAAVIAILGKHSPPLSPLDIQELAKEVVGLIKREKAEAEARAERLEGLLAQAQAQAKPKSRSPKT